MLVVWYQAFLGAMRSQATRYEQRIAQLGQVLEAKGERVERCWNEQARQQDLLEKTQAQVQRLRVELTVAQTEADALRRALAALQDRQATAIVAAGKIEARIRRAVELLECGRHGQALHVLKHMKETSCVGL